VFTLAEMVAAFDIADVNPNPARFDLKKAEAINAAHVRMLAPDDFRNRLVAYLAPAGLVSASSYDELTDDERRRLAAAAPLVQERMTLLGEAVGMLGFLFVGDDDLVVEDDARAALRDDSATILDAAAKALADLPDLTAAAAQEALAAALVDGLGVKPRFAYTPLRVAVTGRRVSPPLFESMEILGREATLARIARLRATL
jgi:glutamyl-tRNA synthetase